MDRRGAEGGRDSGGFLYRAVPGRSHPWWHRLVLGTLVGHEQWALLTTPGRIRALVEGATQSEVAVVAPLIFGLSLATLTGTASDRLGLRSELGDSAR